MPHLILLSPSGNRVYAGEAARLSTAELSIMLGDPAAPVSRRTLAGVDYLELGLDELSAAALGAVARLSTRLALFEASGFEPDQHVLRPVELPTPDRFDDDMVTIPKYAGKTNEQFTRLLVNVTAASAERELGPDAVLLDPLCGRGTTLSTAVTLGFDAAGVDADAKAVEAYAAFLKTYLRRKRIKHSAELRPVRREGRSLGQRLDVRLSPASGRELGLSVLTGDTRDSAALYGKRRFDLVVADAPYGVVHGSRTSPGKRGRERSAAGLLSEAIGVWAGQLKRGGALGLSWNTYAVTRERLSEIATGAGLVVRTGGPYEELAHRVDSSILRDVLVAVRPAG